jgi:NAD+ diphosphatase
LIRTPDGFSIALDLALHEASVVHPFVGESLLSSDDPPQARPWAFYRGLGCVVDAVEPLGIWRGEEHLAIALKPLPEALPKGWRLAGLRQWFGLLPDDQLAIAMRGSQLLQWARTHRFCGGCATPTEQVVGERARRCPVCKLASYPRISPAMMVLITRGRHLLLARGHQFPPGRYSALAGFLEAGETIEQAICREVHEEVGVDIDGLRYFGSQSWPFPHSLMIAFRAEWAGGDIRVDPHELADAQWFEPDRLPQLPPPLSIARALIDSALNELGVRADR